jgi:hypothetical protein
LKHSEIQNLKFIGFNSNTPTTKYYTDWGFFNSKQPQAIQIDFEKDDDQLKNMIYGKEHLEPECVYVRRKTDDNFG